VSHLLRSNPENKIKFPEKYYLTKQAYSFIK